MFKPTDKRHSDSYSERLLSAVKERDLRDSWLLKALRIKSSGIISHEQDIYNPISRAHRASLKKIQNNHKSQNLGRKAMNYYIQVMTQSFQLHAQDSFCCLSEVCT